MFPEVRLRRLRKSEGIRRMLDAPPPGPEKFMWPTFVIDGENRRAYGRGHDSLLGLVAGMGVMALSLLLMR